MQIAGTQTSPLFDERKMTAKSPSPIFKQEKSGTETWFLADARCPAGYQCRCPTLCRKPDSGLPHRPVKGNEEINLVFAAFQAAAC
jgi:hypothetical protein